MAAWGVAVMSSAMAKAVEMMNIILAVNDAQTVLMDVYNPNMYLH